MPTSILVEKKKLAKPPLQMYYLGDRVLRQPAKRIANIDEELRQTIVAMLQTMYSADGIGLAAPQVGIHKQLIVIDCEFEDPTAPPLVLINPKLESVGKTLCKDQEGCLSIPGVYLDVERPDTVEVSYKDEFGRPRKLKADGLLARAIQHELDHLTGILFVDRVDNEIALAEELKQTKFSLQHVQHIKSGK